MNWIEVNLVVSPEATDLVALLLYECGGNGSIIHDDEKDELGRIRITAYFPPENEAAVEMVPVRMKALAERTRTLGTWQFFCGQANDEQWLYAWHAYFHPKKISRRFWAAPPWEPVEAGEDETVLFIDPGLAFGSGFHDTTCMCVQYLEDTVRPGDVVIDVGTGTGILAIASAKLGARRVTALDFDENAVAQAAINIEKNNVKDIVRVYNSDLLTALSADEEKADIVAANLVTAAVLELMPSLPPYMKKDSVLIASGIIDERIGEIRQAAAQTGFLWEDERLQNGWYAVKLRRT